MGFRVVEFDDCEEASLLDFARLRRAARVHPAG